MDHATLALKVATIGAGTTLFLDIWSLFLKAVFGLPFPDFAMIGRWIGHFRRGQFVQRSMAETPAVAGEHIIGWMAHYCVGILFASLLIAVAGANWLAAPTLPPALLVGLTTVAAPLLVMHPAMGLGVAGSKAANPPLVRLRSVAAHIVFGIGLFLSAAALALIQ